MGCGRANVSFTGKITNNISFEEKKQVYLKIKACIIHLLKRILI